MHRGPTLTDLIPESRLWWQKPGALAILSGVLLALSFPPLPFGFFAYFGLVPLFSALKQTKGQNGFRLGYLTGLAYCTGVMYWIGMNTGTYQWAAILSAAMAVVFIALNIGLFGLAMGFIYRRNIPGGWWWAAPLWVSIEFLRSFGTLAFPWGNLSLSQAHYLPLLQMAGITGMYGISFWILLLNVALFYYLQSRATGKIPVKWASLIVLIYLVPLGYGVVVLQTLPGQAAQHRLVRVGVVQPNVDPNRKGDAVFREQNFALLDSLSRMSASHHADMLVWPESAAPDYIRLNRFGYRTRIQHWVDSSGIPILTGTVDWKAGNTNKQSPHDGYYFNAAVLFQPGHATLQTYRKRKLVPFAEYIPYPWLFGFFNTMDLGQGWFTPGRQYTIFESHDPIDTRFSAAICYDTSFPGLIRQFRRRGAQWLAIMTNDAWFGNSSGPFQHAQWARIRAVENRMPVVRAANTGTSMLIDPWGRVQGRLPLHEMGTLTGTIDTGVSPSWYARHGNVFSGLVTGIALLGIGAALIRQRKSKR